MSKMALIYRLALEKMADIFDFTHNAMSKVVVYHTTMSSIPENYYGKHQNHKSASIMSRNGIDPLFDLGKVAAILNFNNNAIPMSGIPENLMIDTEIMNLLQLCEK